ncbi:kinesin-like protein KIN-14H isoform X1 [Zingiber officinale]|uniref:kinesin-like protein KIN-14H isoform X1 n=1 Tax=Zingiber officinale TaxID=94328 RepID=UPI001C4DABD0|nr:kinesin-like protein KIN-14H isoform X1 [Zingiber officinale]
MASFGISGKRHSPRISSHSKENRDGAPLDKRRRMVGKEATPPDETRARKVFSSVNSDPDPVVPLHHSGIEFLSREDVEKLLGEEMKGKNNSDSKMMEYVEKLKICIKWHMAREDGYLEDQKKQRNFMEDEEKRHNDIVTQLRAKIDELETMNNEPKAENRKFLENERDAQITFESQEEIKPKEVLNTRKKKHKEQSNEELSCLRSELQQVKDDCNKARAEVQSLTLVIAKYEEITKTLDMITMKTVDLEETCAFQRTEILSLQHQLSAKKDELKQADLSVNTMTSKVEEQKIIIEELKNHLVEGEKLLKKQHNTILELKGNIRVFCRVRPIMANNDSSGTNGAVISYPTSVESFGRGIDLTHGAQKHSFTFDKVFSYEASQEDVFVEISQLVQSAFDGYKVCIFAYGQTGSGKTYTMMGNPNIPEQKGLISRSLEQIFEASQSLQCQGWEYKIKASMLEIYNETIRDLLSPSCSSSVEGKQYSIKHDANGNTVVSDLTVVDVCTEQAAQSLHQAACNRSLGKTNMNEQSSRSHVIFTLKIVGTNESTKDQVQGILNLIDLAGSERLAKSGCTGDRLKETQAINKSLSALNDVISALANKEDHVPFRNSKLTYLLQPCLSGDSKILMLLNISPEASSSGESISSLRFAARVNNCVIGIPRRHIQMRSRSDSRPL